MSLNTLDAVLSRQLHIVEVPPFTQTELKPTTAPVLQKAVPALTDELLEEMQVSPLRQFDPNLIQEPLVYRLYEVGCYRIDCLLTVYGLQTNTMSPA